MIPAIAFEASTQAQQQVGVAAAGSLLLLFPRKHSNRSPPARKKQFVIP
jgi:hypothetical protein